ncbi:DUF3768 domain-containing protein [Maricaulis sp.]|uniref:DUF3768 domain-containing protein n=1 Tax=Maricaulis sp. TaxID=1486257 RepID=UPI0032975D23
METTTDCRTCTIRELNDDLRIKGEGGQMFMTQGVKEKGEVFYTAAVHALRVYDDFTSENDPYGDHDFGRFVIQGEALLWKIDYYDENMEFGSDDPSNPDKTTRVLTLMLANEY